jgi:putative membrane protein
MESGSLRAFSRGVTIVLFQLSIPSIDGHNESILSRSQGKFAGTRNRSAKRGAIELSKDLWDRLSSLSERTGGPKPPSALHGALTCWRTAANKSEKRSWWEGFMPTEQNHESVFPRGTRPPDIMSDDRIFLAWQRSHMANERTFLAWARTSISLLAFGFVIERFEIFLKHLFQLTGTSVPGLHSEHIVYLSLFSFFLAGFAILFSGLRFVAVRRHINRGEAVFSVVPDVLVIISVVVIIIITIALSVPRLFFVTPGM